MKPVWIIIALGFGVRASTGLAADLPAVLPIEAAPLPTAFDWSGLYVGAHTGFGQGRSSATLTDPATTTAGHTFGGTIGGVQAGYNYVLPSGVLLGVEADFTFPNYLDSNSAMSMLMSARSDITERLDYIGTARGRLGVINGDWLAYVTGGLAWSGTRFVNTTSSGEEEKRLHVRTGWVAGAGVEYAFAPHWSARLEYLYSQPGSANAAFASGARYTSASDFQSLRIGLNRKIGGLESGLSSSASWIEPESDRWEIHGQTTYLAQGHPTFRAPYSGPNNLMPNAQMKATWSNSLFLNARLWDGGEVYYNPELARRASASAIRSGRADFPAAKRKNPISPIRITTPRGCSCGRHSVSAANRKNLPAARRNSPARRTFLG